MKSLLPFLLLFLLPFGKLTAQTFTMPARQLALAQIKTVAMGHAAYGNPTMGVFSDKIFAFASIENRLLGTDIQGFTVGGSYSNTTVGSFQLGINRMGIEGFFLQEVTIGYAHKIGQKSAIGGSLLLFSRQADHYDGLQRMSFNVGAQFPLSKHIQAGLFLSNPLPDKKEQPAYSFDGEMAAGVTWKLTKLTAAFELSKPQHTKYAIKTALDYQPIDALSILGGIVLSENNVQPSIGLSYRFKIFELTMAANFYNQLGPGISFGAAYYVPYSKE